MAFQGFSVQTYNVTIPGDCRVSALNQVVVRVGSLALDTVLAQIYLQLLDHVHLVEDVTSEDSRVLFPLATEEVDV